MDKGPSQWKMKLPPEAFVETAKKEDPQGAAALGQGRRRWSAVMGPISEGVKVQGATVASDKQKKETDEGRPAPSPPQTTEKICEVEVLHEGCCTVRFDTMRHLVEQIDHQRKRDKTLLSPSLPQDEVTEGLGSGQALFIDAKPLVLQSTLPLPQQAGAWGPLNPNP